ncbi:hypothetical protein D7D52_16085 [Nocardia yunnanensis]|uniref:Transposase DDE domain-containing protein n=1 Tax=Nocardia yunnanensis TaxID=2382165 RepID=A0A386ZBY9_9NOCA|nr:hypothetical protein D7D52_16085 [Nocardia yunnanensis]
MSPDLTSEVILLMSSRRLVLQPDFVIDDAAGRGRRKWGGHRMIRLCLCGTQLNWRWPRSTGYHRLTIRYDRKATHFLGFLTLAAALICYKKLVKATT